MSDCKSGASDEALNDCNEGKVSPNSVRPRIQDLLAIQFTQTQHPNAVRSPTIISLSIFQSFIQPATGRGYNDL